MWSKVKELENWKELTKFIKTDNILLPESSKDFITKSYLVIKINAKGKRQERLVLFEKPTNQNRIIKFTPHSLLNIDPRAKSLRDEKLLSQIEEISSDPGSPIIFMKFTEDAALNPRSHRFSINVLLEQHLDRLQRTYVCNSLAERDAILQDIFSCGIKSSMQDIPQEYKVVKVNKAGKHQDRTFKVPCFFCHS